MHKLHEVYIYIWSESDLHYFTWNVAVSVGHWIQSKYISISKTKELCKQPGDDVEMNRLEKGDYRFKRHLFAVRQSKQLSKRVWMARVWRFTEATGSSSRSTESHWCQRLLRSSNSCLACETVSKPFQKMIANAKDSVTQWNGKHLQGCHRSSPG